MSGHGDTVTRRQGETSQCLYVIKYGCCSEACKRFDVVCSKRK